VSVHPAARTISAALILALAALLAGCALQAKKPATPAAPAAPAPVAVKPPAPPPPLSIPQTQVEIPPPQPVSEEALAAGQAPPDEPEPIAPPRPVKRSAPAANPRPEASPAEEPARAPIQEVLSFAERKQLQDSTAERKREIRHLVDLARSRRLNSHELSVVTRIEGLVKLSGDAEAKGDLREADALAQRALVLAKDLDSER
jgi:outer membrane biosynthesis protein TonB